MDLSKLSDKDLDALEKGGLEMVSPEGLELLSAQLPQNNAPQGPDTTSMAGRFAQGFGDPFHGGAQLLEAGSNKAFPGSKEAVRDLNNKVPFLAKLPKGGVDEQVRTREKDYDKSRGDQAGKFDAWRTAGNVLSPPNLAMAALPGAGPMGLARNIMQGIVQGGAAGALNPVTDKDSVPGEDFWDAKARQAGTGALFGGGASGVLGGVGRIFSPNASRSAPQQLLHGEGVPMSIGQTLGGLANRVEEFGASIPFIGRPIQAARDRGFEGFERAAINRSQTPIGQSVQEVGHEGVDQASRNMNQAYDRARNSINNFRTDQAFQSEMGQLRTMAQGEPWAANFNRTVRQHVDNRLTNGGMTGETYHTTIKDLRALADKQKASKVPTQQNYGHALDQVAATMESQARRVNPEADRLFQEADRGFANLAPVQQAASSAVTDSARFTPAQLLKAIKGQDKTVRDNQTARGMRPLQDLADAGQQVLGHPSPSIGDRIGGAGLALTGAGSVAALGPTALLGATGIAAYTPALQRVLRRAALERNPLAHRTGSVVSRMGPAASPLAGAFGVQPGEDEIE